jgi:hypothetical protein
MSTTVNWNYTDENGTTTGGSYTVDGTVDNTDWVAVSWIIWAAIVIVISGVSYCIFVSCQKPIAATTTPAVGLKKPLTMKDIEDEKKWRKNKL